MSQSLVEQAKKAAAFAAVDEFVKSGMKVGVGSGSTVVYVVNRLCEKMRAGELPNIVTVPTSFQSEQLLREAGLTVCGLNDLGDDMLDVAIDGADECSVVKQDDAIVGIDAIKGGGGCQLQEKLVAANAKKFVIVADYRKISPGGLGVAWTKGVPVEVVPQAYRSVQRRIRLLGGSSELRTGSGKAGPVVTDNGNMLLDAVFGECAHQRNLELAQALSCTPGIVEHGLFLDMACCAFFGMQDGSICTWRTLDRSTASL
ncbi:MAG: hypothetical protein MHM6MM_000780 [Cercozoa sp. M6MM]